MKRGRELETRSSGARQKARAGLAVAFAVLSVPATALADVREPSPTADKVVGFYDAIFWAVAAVLVVIEVLIIGAALRPRRPARDEPAPALEGLATSRAEITFTIAPAILLALIAVLSYRAFH